MITVIEILLKNGEKYVSSSVCASRIGSNPTISFIHSKSRNPLTISVDLVESMNVSIEKEDS